MERRAVLAAIASLPGISLLPDTHGSLLEPDAHEIIDHAIERPESVGSEILTPLDTLVMGCRHLDEVLGPRYVAGPANGILRLIGGLLPAVPATIRPSMFALAANAAQLAGWLALDGGDEESARRLYDQALEWAVAADDTEFVAYVWCSRAALARRRVRNPLAAISAAEAARRVAAGRNPTLRAWVERTVGRSYALAGNRSETVIAMERAGELLDEGQPGEAPAWLYHFGPEALLAEHGAALVEVGHGDRAAELLDDALDRLPAGMVRDRGIFLATRALAFKSIGDVGLACAAATEAVSLGRQTGSAWTVAKVDKFHRSLDQSAAQHPDARALGELLHDTSRAVVRQRDA